MSEINSENQVMLAHQYLYYVISKPILTDYEYDQFCKKFGLDGNGGSDRAVDYSPEVIALAMTMLKMEERRFR